MEHNLPSNRSHSADVRIELRLNGYALPIAQLGPGFLVLRSPVEHPPADGEIYMSIDGAESRWRVRLAEGITAQRRKTPIAPSTSFNGSTA